MLSKLAQTLKKLHKKRIAHRCVCVKNVSVKVSTKVTGNTKAPAIKMQLTNFDLAFCFEKDSQEVSQVFNVPSQ